MKLGENVLRIIEYEKQRKIKTNLLALNKYRERRNNVEIEYEYIRSKIKQRANSNFKWN